jgi:hypothetical protein
MIPWRRRGGGETADQSTLFMDLLIAIVRKPSVTSQLLLLSLWIALRLTLSFHSISSVYRLRRIRLHPRSYVRHQPSIPCCQPYITDFRSWGLESAKVSYSRGKLLFSDLAGFTGKIMDEDCLEAS